MLSPKIIKSTHETYAFEVYDGNILSTRITEPNCNPLLPKKAKILGWNWASEKSFEKGKNNTVVCHWQYKIKMVQFQTVKLEEGKGRILGRIHLCLLWGVEGKPRNSPYLQGCRWLPGTRVKLISCAKSKSLVLYKMAIAKLGIIW